MKQFLTILFVLYVQSIIAQQEIPLNIVRESENKIRLITPIDPNKILQIECCTNLNSQVWTNLGAQFPSGIQVVFKMDGQERYYRTRVVQTINTNDN